MNVIQPIRGEKGVTPKGLDADSHGTEHRAIVDTHRHPIGPKLAAKMAERGFYDPKKEFPQTNAQDLIGYREFYDLDYAMPKQREGGVTLSVASNGGEVDWLARDLLQVSTGEALKFLNDEYLEIRDRYPGEFALMANAHALEEGCRPIVEEMIHQGGAKAIAVASSYGDGAERAFLDSPRRNGCRSLKRRMASLSIFIHRCCRSGTRCPCSTASTRRLADHSTRPSTAPG
jgi:hypothetical protein